MDEQYGPKGLVEGKSSSIEDTYNSACEDARLFAIETKLIEALAAKERAEAERDEAKLTIGEAEELIDQHWNDLQICRAEVARLTVALAGAREECAKIAEMAEAPYVADAIRALAHPTTEPAK
jgi:hypothetical protein